jgi:hypothetical protein
MYAMATLVFKYFFGILQVFQLFRTYFARVSSECCISRSGVVRVAMRVRRGEGTSGPACARYCGTHPAWARET